MTRKGRNKGMYQPTINALEPDTDDSAIDTIYIVFRIGTKQANVKKNAYPEFSVIQNISLPNCSRYQQSTVLQKPKRNL